MVTLVALFTFAAFVIVTTYTLVKMVMCLLHKMSAQTAGHVSLSYRLCVHMIQPESHSEVWNEIWYGGCAMRLSLWIGCVRLFFHGSIREPLERLL